MKKFRIYTSTKSTSSFIISSDTQGLYIILSDIPTIRNFINGTAMSWSISFATDIDIGNLLAEFDTFDELVNNYPELFI